MASFIFTFLVIFTVVCAAGVVLNRNAVNGSMCLLLCLGGLAGLFVQLQAFLLAFLLILVYAGAVIALFLFIIMLLDVQGQRAGKARKLAFFSGIIALALLATGVIELGMHGHLATQPLSQVQPMGASMKLYAYQLFTVYLLPVQVVGFLLLISMLGVIVLSKKFDDTEDAK
jgi:NADH-quinone oxidoreductase subunit J